MLVMASTLDVADAAQGRGRLHEMQDQRGAAATVTRSAATAYSARDARDLIAEAFSLFASERPRPSYIEVPIDIMSSPAGDGLVRTRNAEHAGAAGKRMLMRPLHSLRMQRPR